jgi:hypothetical protein
MSSWIKCTCGKLLHKNLFASAKVCVVVQDDVLDHIDGKRSASEAVSEIIANGDILVRCPACGRVAIEHRSTGQIIVYTPEKT